MNWFQVTSFSGKMQLYQGLSINTNILTYFILGSCQVLKNPKIPEKLGLVRHHPPTPLSSFCFVLETFGNMKTTPKNTKKYKIKKKNPSFSRIFLFFLT